MAMNNHQDPFDEAMRRLHADAIAHVSRPVRLRLRAARGSAQAARPPGWAKGGWALASGCAALLALVIGLQLRAPPTIVSPLPDVATATTDAAVYDADTAVAVLDENPDLYLWLASNDDGQPANPEQ